MHASRKHTVKLERDKAAEKGYNIMRCFIGMLARTDCPYLRARSLAEGMLNATRSNYLGGRKITGAEAQHRCADYADFGNRRARQAGKYSRRVSGRTGDKLCGSWSDSRGSEACAVEVHSHRRTVLRESGAPDLSGPR